LQKDKAALKYLPGIPSLKKDKAAVKYLPRVPSLEKKKAAVKYMGRSSFCGTLKAFKAKSLYSEMNGNIW
jgi:hypothetical protein